MDGKVNKRGWAAPLRKVNEYLLTGVKKNRKENSPEEEGRKSRDTGIHLVPKECGNASGRGLVSVLLPQLRREEKRVS